MNHYSISQSTDLTNSQHIGISYLQRHLPELSPNSSNQVIYINPNNPEEISISHADVKQVNQDLDKTYDLIFYGAQFTLSHFNSVQQFLSDANLAVQSIEIIGAPEGKDKNSQYSEFTCAALCWKVKALLTLDLLNQLKSIANEFKNDVWQLSERPSLNEPGLLLMDMDSTVIKIECIDEIAKLAGVGEQVSKVTELAMQGKLDFAESLNARVNTLTNCDQAVLQQVADKLPLMHGLERLVSVLKQHNWRLAIASGGFTFFADKLKALLKLDAAVANVLEIKNGVLTGNVIGGIVDAQVKADTLLKLATEYGIKPEQTVAMGDGANDLVMMAAANLGVAFEAKPLVQEKADVAINHHGLDALLYILKQ